MPAFSMQRIVSVSVKEVYHILGHDLVLYVDHPDRGTIHAGLCNRHQLMCVR